MTDLAQYMQLVCPISKNRSRYGCKVSDECICGVDDDLMNAFERQQVWLSRPGQPLRWEPVTVSIEDQG